MIQFADRTALQMDQVFHTGTARVFPGCFYGRIVNIISLDISFY